MLNQVVLVGRISNDITIKEENDKKYSIINLAVPRPFKNQEGEYETDFIPVILYDMLSQNTMDYCKKGDLVGIKGRLQNNNNLILVAEKVSFLSSKRD